MSRAPLRIDVPCAPGLEPVLESELAALGFEELLTRPGGVSGQASRDQAARACFALRTGLHVQELLADGPIESPQELYELCARVDFERLLTPEQTLAVTASIRNSALNHSGHAALVVKDAVVDRLRDKKGKRPNVDADDPILPLRLSVINGRARLYRDWAGTSLHKRGYRPIQVKSPLNECVAAGLLLAHRLPPEASLLDPMCGSGTLLIEAALIATNTPPGLHRSFAAERWIDVPHAVFPAAREWANQQARASDLALEGADRHAGAITIAKESAERAGMAGRIHFQVCDVKNLVPRTKPEVVVANPPWGERLDDDPIGSWNALGKFLKAHGRGAHAFLLSGDAELTRHLGLKATGRVAIEIGPISARFLHYEVHADRASPVTPPLET